jgi:mRNA interferase MazF
LWLPGASSWPRAHDFAVVLNSKGGSMVVLCHQVKMIDFTAKGITLAQKAHKDVARNVFAKVKNFVGEA